MPDAKPYLDDQGNILWIPDDPENLDWKMAQTGYYAEVDPETGLPLEGELQRAAQARQAQAKAELQRTDE